MFSLLASENDALLRRWDRNHGNSGSIPLYNRVGWGAVIVLGVVAPRRGSGRVLVPCMGRGRVRRPGSWSVCWLGVWHHRGAGLLLILRNRWLLWRRGLVVPWG